MFVCDYGQLSLHRLMLSDEIRTGTYRKALSSTVKPGDVVLDVGAGTGIMAMLAAQAGARKVYAVEKASIAELARRLIEQNGLEDKIELIHSEIESVALPDRVDLLVGEWMGCYGVDENLLPSIVIARDRWLKPGGSVLPEVVAGWLAPVEDDDLADSIESWRRRPYDLDFDPLAHATANEVLMGQHQIGTDDLLAEPQQLWTTDVRSISLDDARAPFSAQLGFLAGRGGRLSALAAWFVARFPDGSVLTNSPDAPDTHWGRSVFPLNAAIEVTPGLPMEVELICDPAGPGYCHHRWAVKVGEADWEHHNTRWDVTLGDS